MSDIPIVKAVRKSVMLDRDVDVSAAMTVIHADTLREEKRQLNELSDELYGHVDQQELNRIHGRIQDINKWLSHLEYI